MNRKKFMLETLPVLFLCALGGLLTGMILGNMVRMFKLIPGLIALIPAIINMRGNISSTMGSRMGSAYHLGMVERGITSKVTMENLKSSWALSFFIGALLPVLFWLTSLFLPFRIETNTLIILSLISISTGFTSGIILSFTAYFTVIMAIRMEMDPDNISGPLLTTMGDVLTLMILFFYAYIIGVVIL